MTAKIFDVKKQLEQTRDAASKLPSGPEPPDNEGMNARLVALETRFDAVLPTLATRADIGELRADFKGWTLTTALTIVGSMVAGFIGVATLMLRNQPAPQPAAQPAPIIINVPGAPAVAAPPAPSKR